MNPEKFYLLYGVITDANHKPIKIEYIGQFLDRADCAREINKLRTKYNEYMLKEDYIEDLPSIVYAPFTLPVTDTPVITNYQQDKRPKIFCIVGESGVGKTSLALHLQEQYNIPTVCSYTTRPMRDGETNGVEHKFVSDFNVEPEDMLAYTLYGGYHYWTTHNQVRDHNLVTYVIDRRGLNEMINQHADKYKIIAVLITRDNRDDIDLNRKQRDIENPTDGDYDIILTNNFDTLEEFFDYSADKFKAYIEQMQKFTINK